MLLRHLLPALLLFVTATSAAQDFIVGGNLTKAQIEDLRKAAASGEAAVKRLGLLQNAEVKLRVGDFFPFKFGSANQLWLPTNESVYSRLEVPAGQKFALWGTLADDKDKKPSLHTFDAKPDAWGFLVGAKEGISVIQVIANGEGMAPPVVIQTITVIVGEPAPDVPPIPIDDPLTKALREALAKDAAANKADKAVLKTLAGLYRIVSGVSLDAFQTIGELDAKLYATASTLNLPPPDQQLTALRYAVKDTLQRSLGVSDTGGSTPFNPDTRRQASATLAKIAAVLEVLSK